MYLCDGFVEIYVNVSITVCENSNTFILGVWCNGNTTGFGPVIMSSNLVAPTSIYVINNKFVNVSLNFFFDFRLIIYVNYSISSDCEVTTYFYINKVGYLHRQPTPS